MSNSNPPYDCDVVIIGAGPSGSVASSLLRRKGYSVTVIERETFPRFSIGESLLPQCMAFLEEADLLSVIQQQNFQYKEGAAFNYAGKKSWFDFRKKSASGFSTTYQVTRADFDKALIDKAESYGVNVFYGRSVIEAKPDETGMTLTVQNNETGETYPLRAKFCLDASGYGSLLAKLLGMARPSSFPSRAAYFTHVQDNITEPTFNRDYILITVHPDFKDIWFWLIPFSKGRASLGVVGEEKVFTELAENGYSNEQILKHFVSGDAYLSQILDQAVYDTDVRSIVGYASDVTASYGQSFALLGNAGTFLDPVFSSGVTIAMKSASLACKALDKQLKGESVDWENEFAVPLSYGISTFKGFVEKWYEGELIDIFLSEKENDPEIHSHICSILAGYAWDENNPFTHHTRRRLKALWELCQA